MVAFEDRIHGRHLRTIVIKEGEMSVRITDKGTIEKHRYVCIPDMGLFMECEQKKEYIKSLKLAEGQRIIFWLNHCSKDTTKYPHILEGDVNAAALIVDVYLSNNNGDYDHVDISVSSGKRGECWELTVDELNEYCGAKIL